MAKYVALLRGIGPSNPNMHGPKLASVLVNLGYANAKPLLSSGNVVFESDETDMPAMESRLEEAWPKLLGFNSCTIIRSQAQLLSLVKSDPYKGIPHSRSTYALVTFFKQSPTGLKQNYYTDLGVNALCSTIDATASKTPDFMVKLERQFGRDITSRTWLTIQRILKKMDN
jgi:uncharacterized protein (DUF1697 family)